MKEICFKVKGMACTGCENRIKKKISNIEGVQTVEANHETGIVKVIGNEQIQKEIVEAAIESLDYTVIKEE